MLLGAMVWIRRKKGELGERYDAGDVYAVELRGTKTFSAGLNWTPATSCKATDKYKYADCADC